MIHLTLVIGQRVITYCGSTDFRETMRGEHYKTHVMVEDCCKQLHERICIECIKEMTFGKDKPTNS